eukprot:scaffold6934_cov121-Isochrysis_galbana.AAC.15
MHGSSAHGIPRSESSFSSLAFFPASRVRYTVGGSLQTTGRWRGPCAWSDLAPMNATPTPTSARASIILVRGSPRAFNSPDARGPFTPRPGRRTRRLLL